MIKRNVKNMCAALAVAVCSVLGFSSCEDDDRMGVGDGTGMRVTVDAVTQFSGVDASRAVLDNEIEITNYVLLLYGGTDRTATLKAAHETVKLPADVTLPYPETGKSYLAIMIANTTLASLGDAAAVETATIEDLFSATFDINTTDNNPNDATKFTWSGYRNYASSTRNLTFFLNPNLAKIQVSVSNETGTTSETSDDIQLVNIQVRNVPNKARYAQNALSKAGLFTVADNETGVTDYLDYEIEALELAKGESTSTPMYWYMPHNEAGKGVRPSSPATNATWIEVDGIRRLDFIDTAYKIYPTCDEFDANGTRKTYNALDSFNIKADYQYNFTMRITDDGLKFESNNNVTDKTTVTTGVDKVKLPWNSNSYMIHPLGSMSANGTLYELPINRINEYWGSTYGVNDASMQVGDATEWEAYVIWQDIPERAIYFADKDGNVNKSSTVFPGKGVTPIYFKLANQTTSNATQTYGNVLIGVRNKSTQTTLWSWHLWITDYNPDAALPYSVAKNVKSSTTNAMFQYGGNIDLQQADVGNVQHYTNNKHSYWSKFIVSHAAWNNSTGIYSNSWIMDRNLGAQDVAGWDDDQTTDYARTKVFGMYYQFGRKDPFPYSAYMVNNSTANIVNTKVAPNERKVYDINGNQVYWNYKDNSTTTRTIKESVMNPSTFYATGVDWCSQSNTNIWNNPKTINRTGKSIFDPCPPGWCVPTFDAFEFFTFDPSYTGFAKTSTGKYYVYGYYQSSTNDGNSSKLCPCANVYIDVDANGNQLAYSPKNSCHVVLWSTGVSTNPTQWLYIIFPMQGALASYYDGFSDFTQNHMWLSEPSVNNSTNGATLQFRISSRSTYNADGSSRDLTIPSTAITTNISNSHGTFDIYPGLVSHYGWVRSRGQNIRCIQVPDGETPQFYNEAK